MIEKYKKLEKFYKNRFQKIKKELKNNLKINLNEINNINVYDSFLFYKNENIILIIGEAPGSKEVELKKQFCGPSGKNSSLNRESDFIITNAFPFRTFSITNSSIKNRTPNIEELKIGSKLLIEKLKIIKPKIILLLGGSALKVIKYIPELNENLKNLNRNEFKEIDLFDFKTKIMRAYHPSPLVYNQKIKKEDLIKSFNLLSFEYKY
jgi:DNA polymerase